MMNGTIRVESQLNRGTRFIATIYLKLAGEEDTGERSQNGNTPRTPASFPPGTCVLLAEDNELNWEIASELLSDLGVELEWAEDGQICLDKFRESPEGYYDFILMDLRMPHMTGYEAAQAIRGLNRADSASVPIIAMTADAFAEDIQRCLECGMNAHIAKPIDVAELTRLLKKHSRKV